MRKHDNLCYADIHVDIPIKHRTLTLEMGDTILTMIMDDKYTVIYPDILQYHYFVMYTQKTC